MQHMTFIPPIPSKQRRSKYSSRDSEEEHNLIFVLFASRQRVLEKGSNESLGFAR